MGMGKTCEPKAFSFQCMTKFTTKKKKKKLKKFNDRKSTLFVKKKANTIVFIYPGMA